MRRTVDDSPATLSSREVTVTAGSQQAIAPESAASKTSAVRALSLGKHIDDRAILDEIDLDVPMGRFVALVGPNGAGKSTLLHAIATLSPATHGSLALFGQTVHRWAGAALRARIGMIGHQSMLYRDLTALENLTLFGRLYGVDAPGERAAELLEKVRLSDRAHDPPKAFSRGMVQRLSIARALMHNPDLLLADEPFAGLDVPSTRNVEALLAQLHGEGKTIILTNHEIAQSLRLSEQVVVLRGGRVVLDRPASQVDVDAVTREVMA